MRHPIPEQDYEKIIEVLKYFGYDVRIISAKPDEIRFTDVRKREHTLTWDGYKYEFNTYDFAKDWVDALKYCDVNIGSEKEYFAPKQSDLRGWRGRKQ